WQSRNDWDIWKTIAKKFSELSVTHLGVRKDVVAQPLQHDSPGAMATPRGEVLDWKKGECEPVPGLTLPNLVEVERDYTQIYEKYTSAGPLLEKLGMTTKGITYDVKKYVERLRGINGVVTKGVGKGQPRLEEDLHDLAAEAEGKQITFADAQAAPVPVITSPEWSGSESGGRRYSPFTINVERFKPWHTLTGRQHFYLDHDWMLEMGEALPVFRP